MQFLALFQVCSLLRASITYLHRTVRLFSHGEGMEKSIDLSPALMHTVLAFSEKLLLEIFVEISFGVFFLFFTCPAFTCSFNYNKLTNVTALLDFNLIELRNAR